MSDELDGSVTKYWNKLRLHIPDLTIDSTEQIQGLVAKLAIIYQQVVHDTCWATWIDNEGNPKSQSLYMIELWYNNDVTMTPALSLLEEHAIEAGLPHIVFEKNSFMHVVKLKDGERLYLAPEEDE